MFTVGNRVLIGGGSFGLGPVPSATLISAECPQPPRSKVAASSAPLAVVGG